MQLDTSRLHNPGRPGKLTDRAGTRLDVELTVAEEMALLAWLGDVDEGGGTVEVGLVEVEDRGHPATLPGTIPGRLVTFAT